MIENRLDFVRDTAFRDDSSKIRTGHGPENMATLRSFAINRLRTAGHVDIAAALRTTALRPYGRPLTLIGSTDLHRSVIGRLCTSPWTGLSSPPMPGPGHRVPGAPFRARCG
ncbi:hypothetical protein HDA41_000106 [Streptomyces caelestis]|uniref:Uncharacterized protein n=1 Tax=Streptomyces caelestis TaxID=36816 RepID=A0A7W9GY48_9ACTN|nr:hypothetical protein [Streptomyces caelestis]